MREEQWRRFWIYFIISLFFIIVGLTVSTNDSSTDVSISIAIVTLWIVSGLLLFVVAFRLSESSGFYSPDKEKRLTSKPNVLWFIINAMYVIYLVLSIVWISELSNGSLLIRTVFGVMIILVGLVLLRVLFEDKDLRIKFDLVVLFIFCLCWVIMSIISVIKDS